jgi:hypothetical protein
MSDHKASQNSICIFLTMIQKQQKAIYLFLSEIIFLSNDDNIYYVTLSIFDIVWPTNIQYRFRQD